MAIPDYQSLMLPVLCAAAKGERRVPEVAEEIADELGLAPEDREAMLPSGRQRILHNRIHWAKFYMGKAGLVASPRRGVFTVSAAGKALLATTPKRIDVETLLALPGFGEFYKNQGDKGSPVEVGNPIPPSDSDRTPEEQIDDAFQRIDKILRSELLERIAVNSPGFFEQLIVDLLVAMGYGGTHADAAKQIGRSGDGGVDGVINEDRLGLDRVYVQAKRYSSGTVVGRPEVQGFVGSLVGLGATKGVFVTVSTFSQLARDYVKFLPQRVVLIDGYALASLMIEHGVGVRTSQVVTLKRLDEDFFSEEVSGAVIGA